MDPELMRAFSHPMRIGIINVLADGAATPLQLAEALNDQLTKVCYHATLLRKAGLVRLVAPESEAHKAGEQLYELVPPASFARLRQTDIPPATQGYVSASTLQTIWAKGVAALEAGTLDAREESHFTCMSFETDEQCFQDINEIIDDALERIAAALAASERRAADADAERIPTTIVVANFESANQIR